MANQPPSASPSGWVARLLGLPGQALALGWGFAEGTFFFLVPDLVITLAAMFRPKRALRHLAAAIAGAVLAGALMYAWAERQPDAAQSAVAAVPYVRAEMFTRVETDYAEEGAVSLLKGSLYGIPYKVYAVVAPRHISTAEFLAMTVPARASRLVLTWGFFAGVGLLLRRLRPESSGLPAGVHAACWTAFYAYYWWTI